MKPIKLALLATAAIISQLSIFPATSHAVQNAANFTGDITLKQDSTGANTGIHFSNNTYQNSASPWSFSNLDIYFNVVGGKVAIGGLPDASAPLQVYSKSASGQAALFQINNVSNPNAAVYGTTSGSGQAVFGKNLGTGRAGHFQIVNLTSGASALVAETNGSGYAAEFLGNMRTTGTITFADASAQTTAKTDCMGRYEDNGDGTISDCRTGLIWLKDANCLANTVTTIDKSGGVLTLADAIAWTADLRDTICGLTDGSFFGDWRLPTKTEMMAMVSNAKKQGFTHPALTNRAGTGIWTAGDPFNNVQSFYYWADSTTSYNWIVNMHNGYVYDGNRTSLYYVWPVRSGQ
jgi:hypothetical protein